MDRIKIGIMGFGAFSERRLIPAFEKSKHAEIFAISKRNPGKARARADHFGIPHAYAYSDKQGFLNTPGLDAVFIASSNNVHLADTQDCLKAGKHVLLEKPMGMNAAECEQMVEAAEKAGKELMIAHCLRYNKTVNHVKEIVDSGELGELISGKCDFFSDGRASARSWKYDKGVAGGGAAFDLGVHMVDTMRYITGLQVLNTFCLAIPRNRGENDVDEVASFMLEMDKEFTAICVSSFRGTRKLLLEFFGEKGYVRAYDWNENGQKIRVESDIGREFKQYEVQNGDMYSLEIDDFCRCIRGEIENPIPGSEGLINQRIIDLVNR
ncbi:MAG: Gfo/Idh/MocA family protein [Candidatus Hodarchaeota archaeon]